MVCTRAICPLLYRAYHGEEWRPTSLSPCLRHQEQPAATRDREDPVEDTPRMLARHGHLDLLPTRPRTGHEGGGDERLVQHRQPRVVTGVETPCEPPVAWRHVAGRRAKRWRGRCHRRPQRVQGLGQSRGRLRGYMGAEVTGARVMTAASSGSRRPWRIGRRPRRLPGATRAVMSPP